MSKHVPTLPSLPSWETPISASRDIVEAITDAADSAVDAATSAVRSARRRRAGRRSMRVLRASWRWIAGVAVIAAVVAVVRRRRGTSAGDGAAAGEGVGRSEPARSDGRVQEYGDDILAGATTHHAGTTVAD